MQCDSLDSDLSPESGWDYIHGWVSFLSKTDPIWKNGNYLYTKQQLFSTMIILTKIYFTLWTCLGSYSKRSRYSESQPDLGVWWVSLFYRKIEQKLWFDFYLGWQRLRYCCFTCWDWCHIAKEKTKEEISLEKNTVCVPS